jgi:hypothetical protein
MNRGTTYAVKHDDEIAGLWHRLTTSANSLPRKGRRFAASRERRHHSENLAASFRGLLVLHEITYG